MHLLPLFYVDINSLSLSDLSQFPGWVIASTLDRNGVKIYCRVLRNVQRIINQVKDTDQTHYDITIYCSFSDGRSFSPAIKCAILLFIHCPPSLVVLGSRFLEFYSPFLILQTL